MKWEPTMMTVPEIVAFVEDRIGHIYRRPRMYGGNPEGVDLILHDYHELWATIHEKYEEHHQIITDFYGSEGCQAMNFATYYTSENPMASEQETSRYVVEQWKRLDVLLGLAIPVHDIRQFW
jgi:hypothetical protein